MNFSISSSGSMCNSSAFTDEDHYYQNQIHQGKSWAWWLNVVGEFFVSLFFFFRQKGEDKFSGTFVVFGIGTTGNLLCLLVLCRRSSFELFLRFFFKSFSFSFRKQKGLRRNSYTQYLIALAIVDTGAILAEGCFSARLTKFEDFYLFIYFSSSFTDAPRFSRKILRESETLGFSAYEFYLQSFVLCSFRSLFDEFVVS